LAAIAVALGAFGAHGLQRITTDEQIIHSYQTGVQYQMYHAMALLITAILFRNFSNKKIKWAGTLFIIGIILFSGSLYLITFLKIQDNDLVKYAGPITPFGGIFFIAGWLLLIWGIAGTKN
jgi:uncharacterized membrane protein YgdD (TMEM256/DUF423 family)